MKKIMMFFLALHVSPLWGMEIVRRPDFSDKNSFIAALNYRMSSNAPIVLHFQRVKDDVSELAMLNTVRKGIQAVATQDINVLLSALSRSSKRGLHDEGRKNYGDEIHNGWIALCTNVPYSKAALMNVHKYCLSSKMWNFGQREVDCTLPEGCTYNDLEKSDMVVVNIPDSDDASINSCFTLIRSLQAKGIPLLVNSDRRLLEDLWDTLGDLFPEKEDIKVFSNSPLCDNDSDDNDDSDGRDDSDDYAPAKFFSGRQSESEDIFKLDGDNSILRQNGGQQLDPEEDIFAYFSRLGDGAEFVGEIAEDDNNDARETSSDIVQQVALEKAEEVKSIDDTLQGDVVIENNSGVCCIL